MKKIYQFIKGILKGILNNLDYLAAFVIGAAAYKFAPEQLESIKETILTFDYATAWMSIKGLAMSAWDLGVEAYDYIVGLFSEAPVEVAE